MQVWKRCLPVFVISLSLVTTGPLPLAGAQGNKDARGDHSSELDTDFTPHLGTSHYLIELNGVNIGTGWISVHKDGEYYRIRYEARTNKRVDRIYKARYSGEGVMETDPLSPVRAELKQRVRSKSKQTTIFFEEGGRIITTETKTEKGGERENEVWETQADRSILDPMSAVFLLQGIDWDVGKKRVFDVYTGKARYETRFTCVDRVTLEIEGRKRNAWVIEHESKKLEDKNGAEKEEQKPVLKIYVSADGSGDVLKVETTRKIGHVTLSLVEFDPA